MKQGKNKYTGPLCAGYLILALVASAAEQQLVNPPPSEFVDAESSVNVPIPTDEGRHIKLTIAFESNGDCPRFLRFRLGAVRFGYGFKKIHIFVNFSH